ncbi:alpha/beta hydrolase family protein [Pseudonocardia sichuanensis]
MTLPGYFFSCGADEPRPVVVALNGFDGTGEEIWSMVGCRRAGARLPRTRLRGPGAGPGDPRAGLPFRPDWEHVIGPVVDLAAARPDVRADRIGLLGISMGGVLAPRAAAFDDRIVAFDGVYDMATV